MFPNHYYIFDKNKGMPLYFYTQFFQPHILAVPIVDTQGFQVLTTALLERPGGVVSSSCFPVHPSHLIPVNSSYIQEHNYHKQETEAVWQSNPAVRTVLEPIPDDYKFSFTKKLDDQAETHCSRSSPVSVVPPNSAPPTPAPPKPAPPLGSTPRRQNRRRMLIITKTKKINFDLPEESD